MQKVTKIQKIQKSTKNTTEKVQNIPYVQQIQSVIIRTFSEFYQDILWTFKVLSQDFLRTCSLGGRGGGVKGHRLI